MPNIVVSQTQPSTPQVKTAKNPLSRKDRLFRVQIGVAARKSNRQIAKELGVDEGTIRRDRRTLRLSKEDLQAVRAGSPVEPLLQKQDRQKAATAREKHEAAEQDSQFLSNRLIKLIADWWSQFRLPGIDALHVVRGIERWSWECQSPKGIYIPDSKIKPTIERVKPKADHLSEVFAVIEFAKEWLFQWIVLVEPDRDIRDRALTRIRQQLERENAYC